MIDLLQPVRVKVPNDDRVVTLDGVLVGRTIEEKVRYDIRLKDGAVLAGIPYGLVEQA